MNSRKLNRRRLLRGLAVLAGGVIWPQTTRAGGLQGDDKSSEQELQTLSWVIEGIQRTALLHRPREDGPRPLVLAFHGHGGSSARFARSLDLHWFWPEAMVVYPQGLPTPSLTDPKGDRSGWQFEGGAEGNRDLALVDQIVANLRARFEIDPRRIHACGHSNGGLFSYQLWCLRSDLLASIAVSAAVSPDLARSEPTPRPVLHLGDLKDNVVPWDWQLRAQARVREINRCAPQGQPWPVDPEAGTIFPSAVEAPLVVWTHRFGHRFPKPASGLIAEFLRAHPQREGWNIN